MSTTDPIHEHAVEVLADLIPRIAFSPHVRSWPEDEQEFYRHGAWVNFTDRKEKLDQMRRLKAARRILAAGYTPPPAVKPVTDFDQPWEMGTPGSELIVGGERR